MSTAADPKQVGPYTVLRRLGEGGMGVVYLARDASGHLVAIKVLHAALSEDPDFQQRFRQEIAAARRVARFCTAPLLDAGSEGELTYLVTEYVEGPTLAQAVKERGPLRGASLESVAVGVAVALDAIHSAGVMHRDLKPANVMLSPYGPKVIDFGLARLDAHSTKASDMAVGTPAFMSPERACGLPGSSASDIFSWGSVVAYAGTGRSPFGGDSIPSMLYQVVNGEPDLTGLDDRLRTLVGRAMAKEPGDRPTARELLDAFLGRAIGVERARQVAEDSWSAAGEQRRFRPGLVAAIALLCALVVTGTIIGVIGSKPSVAAFSDDFDSDRGWPRSGVAAAYTDAGYQIDVGAGQELVPTAPAGQRRLGDVTVSATARMTRGDGGWGVWCYGDSVQESRARYDFYLTAAGEVAIFKQVRGGRPVELVPYTEVGGGPSGQNRVEAHCATVPEGVSLRMMLNGRQVAAVVDRTAAYGAGAVGVAVYSGRRPTTVTFGMFTVRRLRT